MAKRQFQFREQELEQFEQAEAQTRDTHELKRLQAVRLYRSGTERRVVEMLVGSDERSIRKWAQKYQQVGLDGLKSHWQGENALKLSREQQADLKQRLQQCRPDQVIAAAICLSRGQFWTVSDLQIVGNA